MPSRFILASLLAVCVVLVNAASARPAPSSDAPPPIALAVGLSGAKAPFLVASLLSTPLPSNGEAGTMKRHLEWPLPVPKLLTLAPAYTLADPPATDDAPLAALPQRPATTCTVSTTTDAGASSLRQCLLNAASGDRVEFSAATFPRSAPATIRVLSPLPTIRQNGLTIDATAAGVILDGGQMTAGNGLLVDGADGVTIRGLQILNFPSSGIQLQNGARNTVIGGDRVLGQGNVISGNRHRGIWIRDAQTSYNRVLGNFIGVDVTGTQAQRNTDYGILISAGAHDNSVGSSQAGAGNVISGNGQAGIVVFEAGTTANRIQGNRVGTDVTGMVAVGNGLFGVVIGAAATANLVGGVEAGAGNVVSGNRGNGIWIQESGTDGNQVQGNLVGVRADGGAALKNVGVGVGIVHGAQNNEVGGTTANARNIISGNGVIGVDLWDAGTSRNRIWGNYIGTDITGSVAIPNEQYGLYVFEGPSDNEIGGDTEGSGNVISGNTQDGILLRDSGTMNNRVLGNYIGTDPSGTRAIPNHELGILVMAGASGNTIGGVTPGARNIISGNQEFGIQLQNEGTRDNRVLGNFIGTDVTGALPIGNGKGGVAIGFSADGNRIGGEELGAGNVISGNIGLGVTIEGAGPAGNQVVGNLIGTDRTGTYGLDYTVNGVNIANSPATLIGGVSEAARNVISGNSGGGVVIFGQASQANRILNNYIGTDITGHLPISNTVAVALAGGASNNTVGEVDAGNVLSGNWRGMEIGVANANGNHVAGNLIGVDASGQTALGNLEHGICVGFGVQDNVIERNVVSGNGGSGIVLQNLGTAHNHVQGNLVGPDASGTRAIGNAEYGIVIGFGASENLIGGASLVDGNLVSGNPEAGIFLQDTETISNTIQANRIGTDATGTRTLPNLIGVYIGYGASHNTVGGSSASTRNIISGNYQTGVAVFDPDSQQNVIIGNYIGTDISGTRALGNGFSGIQVSGGVETRIGGLTPDERNVISGNNESGITLAADDPLNGVTRLTQVQGNLIGLAVNEQTTLPNAYGVTIAGAARDNDIGLAGAGNRIGGNGVGVRILGPAEGNRVRGNTIGALGVGNRGDGVRLAEGTRNNIVGGLETGAANHIGSNGGAGIRITGPDTSGNQALGNTITCNTEGGVVISGTAYLNIIGPGNTITCNSGPGVQVDGQLSRRNKITRNLIYDNTGLAIDWINQAPPPTDFRFPRLEAYDLLTGVLTGLSCANCRIEVFWTLQMETGGRRFLCEAVANSAGRFTCSIPDSINTGYANATATDLSGTTYEFGRGLGLCPARSLCAPPPPLYLPLIMRNAGR